jgi:hypothetical protein
MEPNQQQQQNDQNTQQPQAGAAQPSPQELAALVAQEMQQFQQQQQSQRTIQDMSPEERAEYLQVFDPSANDFDKKFADALQNAEDPTTRRQVISEFRDGVVNQALRGAELIMEQRLAQMNTTIAPAVQIAQKQQADALWDEFKSINPAFEKQRTLIDTVSSQLAQSGFRPKSKAELFTKVAEMSQVILQQAGVNVPAPGQQSTQRTTTPSMSQQRTVGGSAAGGQTTPTDGQRIAPFLLRRSR